MTQTIHAVYENGVFHPTERAELPDHCEVEMDVRLIRRQPHEPTLDDVYAVLSKRYESGEHDVAERHNQHQP